MSGQQQQQRHQRRPAPRPKRAGETFARTHHGEVNPDDPDGPSSKRVRFDIRNPSALAPEAAEEDAILELDEIGKGGAQAKRNAVNLDGYESDSSNEGFDARAAARAAATKKKSAGSSGEQAADENDMFADLEDDLLGRDGDGDGDEEGDASLKKGKKEVRFLDEEEIEGQVEGSKAGGHVSADFSLNGIGKGKGKEKEKARAYESSTSESEGGGEEGGGGGGGGREIDEEVGAGGKKVHAPKLSAFHMKDELEEGRFDAQGNFVRRAADPDAVHDAWMEGISKKDRRRAREAESKREEERRQRTLHEDQVLTSDLLRALISRLERGETVLEALARLGTGDKKEKKKTPRWKKGRRQQQQSRGGEDDEMRDIGQEAQLQDDPAEKRRREAVEAITDAADLLLTRGQTDIYDDSREVLMRQYQRETGEEWVDPSRENGDADGDEMRTIGQTKQWEYRWTDARDDGAIHGPYDGQNMRQWQDAGYFGEGIEFRRAVVDGVGDWSRSVDFV